MNSLLELDGKPHKLTNAQIKKYGGKWIFRCGLEYITVNRTGDNEIDPITCASVHVLTSYQHHEFDETEKVNAPKGELRYHNSKKWSEGTKSYHYDPQFITIGYSGVLTVNNDPYLAYFLDNHPYNEKVKANVKHPNHIFDAGTYFATVDHKKRVAAQQTSLKLMAELVQKIFNPELLSADEIRAIAEFTVHTAKNTKLPHRLFSMKDMDDSQLRTELARLASNNPEAMQQIVENQKIDFIAWINKFRDLEVIKVVGNEWVITEFGKKDSALMKFDPNSDSVASLADWLQRQDKGGNKFKALKEKYEAIAIGRGAVKA